MIWHGYQLSSHAHHQISCTAWTHAAYWTESHCSFACTVLGCLSIQAIPVTVQATLHAVLTLETPAVPSHLVLWPHLEDWCLAGQLDNHLVVTRTQSKIRWRKTAFVTLVRKGPCHVCDSVPGQGEGWLVQHTLHTSQCKCRVLHAQQQSRN